MMKKKVSCGLEQNRREFDQDKLVINMPTGGRVVVRRSYDDLIEDINEGYDLLCQFNQQHNSEINIDLLINSYVQQYNQTRNITYAKMLHHCIDRLRNYQISELDVVKQLNQQNKIIPLIIKEQQSLVPIGLKKSWQ